MDNGKVKSYRWCFVPMCKNTAKNAPSKVFVIVPRKETIKRLWFRVTRRPDTPTKSCYYCCEDHFNLQDDMENYMRFNLMGGPIKMKPGIVPHIFHCQPDRKRTVPQQPREASKKRKRKADVAEILATAECSSAPDVAETENTTPNIPVASDSTYECVQDTSPNLNDLSSVRSDNEIHVKSIKHQGVQVNRRPHFRSKGVSCKLPILMSDTSCSPIKIETPSITIPQVTVNVLCNSEQSSGVLSSSPISSIIATGSSDYETHSEDVQELEQIEKQRMQCNALNITNYFISNNTKSYLGISTEWYSIIDTLHLQTKIPEDHIKLTLMKIKLDDTFERIGDQFGISKTQASKIFSSTVPRLAHMLKTCIYFPNAMSVRKNLPIQFRVNYSNVQSIINCFEIQIKKPTDSVHKEISWTEYKTRNTIKYLVSSSPDGLINFISKGYGNMISDALIVEESGYIDALPEGCAVMADWRFKQIQTLLNKKKCTLIHPNSVSSSVKPSEAEVLKTKCKRVIRRLREYGMLKSHACVHHNLLPQIDYIVTIASALINLQNPLIKT